MRVLVADDDEDIRFLVETLLRRRGWTVTTAVSGLQALALLEESDFDAWVLDQNMPPGSGLEVVERRRQDGDETPAVLFTGFVNALDHALAGEHGAVVIDKVEIKRLPDLLDDLLHGQK